MGQGERGGLAGRPEDFEERKRVLWRNCGCCGCCVSVLLSLLPLPGFPERNLVRSLVLHLLLLLTCGLPVRPSSECRGRRRRRRGEGVGKGLLGGRFWGSGEMYWYREAGQWRGEGGRGATRSGLSALCASCCSTPRRFGSFSIPLNLNDYNYNSQTQP